MLFIQIRIIILLKHILILKATINDFASFCYYIFFMLKLVLRESSLSHKDDIVWTPFLKQWLYHSSIL